MLGVINYFEQLFSFKHLHLYVLLYLFFFVCGVVGLPLSEALSGEAEF